MQVSAKLLDVQHAEVTIHIAPGYHINASDVPSGLCATRVAVDGIEAAIEYPPTARSMNLPDGAKVEVYDGDVTVKISASVPLRGRRVVVHFQPCSASACLERRRLSVLL